MTASWINKANESNSKLHKEDVIRQALAATVLGSTNAKYFLSFAKACYNPFTTFGVKQIPETVGIVNAENPWDEFNALMIKLVKRELTGHKARDAIQAISVRFDSEEWNVFLAPVLRKDLRAGFSERTINKVTKGTEYQIPVFACQLATSCEDRPEMKGEKRLEPKLDGVRVLLMVNVSDVGTSVVCYSRNGKVYENFGHIEKQIEKNITKIISTNPRTLMDGFVLDGEVLGNTFQELMRQARRKTAAPADDSEFNVFDIIPIADFNRGYWNAQLKKRIEMLEKLRPIFDEMDNVDLLPHIMVDLNTAAGQDQFRRYAKDMVAAGFEGIMIKGLDSPYECRRNLFWMKWKPTYDYDLTVIGVEEGSGKYVGKMGALICEGMDDGKHIQVNVGGGYSDAERQEYWDNRDAVIGQTVVVICDAVTQNQDGTYSLRFPRFKTFREDK